MSPSERTEGQIASIGNLARSPVRILAIVVLYKMHPSESPTLRSLLASAKNSASKVLDLNILLWDNTPGGQVERDFPGNVIFRSAPHNPGLAQAYNYALELAYSEGFEWLLTLDQDSVLPGDYLAEVARHVSELAADVTIGAIVPQVIADGRLISPFRFLLGILPVWFARGFIGVSAGATYAANSGSILRVGALRAIGGYDVLFPLDLSDTSLFHRLHQSGQRVFIAGDILLHHDFALLNKAARMSVQRYRASLLDDCAFWDIYMGSFARVERFLRFGIRACKELFKEGQSVFFVETLLELKRRLFKPRKQRIAEWKSMATLRHEESLKNIAPVSLPGYDAAKPDLRLAR